MTTSAAVQRTWDEKWHEHRRSEAQQGVENIVARARDTLPIATNTRLLKLCPSCLSIFPALRNSFLCPDSSGRTLKIASFTEKQIADYLLGGYQCDLCNITCHMCRQAGDEPRTGFHLWSVNILNPAHCARALSCEQQKYASAILVRPHMFPAGESEEAFQREHTDMDNPEKVYKADGLIMYATLRQAGKKVGYCATYLNQDEFDIDAVKSWLGQCRTNHRKCQLPGAMRNMTGMKVIDVQEKRIVKHDSSHSYVALSYVWGPELKQDSLKDFPEACPRVISDAIAATGKLGYRYLWVDRYCIDQQQGPDKQIQIGQMDLIYESADLTFVAAAGNDDTYGLPGVGRESDAQSKRKRQPMIQTEEMMLVSTLPDISHHMQNSQWATRGWTYQEALLSRRCLIFTQDQVFFACRTMCRSETIPNLPTLREEGIQDLNLRTIFWPDAQLGTGAHEDDLRHHAKMYAMRTLKYDTDALNAFIGILNRAKMRSYYGVPILASTPRSARASNGAPTMTDLTQTAEEILNCFLFGLLWYVSDSEEALSREQIPSWTWISIKGSPVDFRYSEIPSVPHPLSLNPPEVSVWVRDDENRLVLFEDWARKCSKSMIPFNGVSLTVQGHTTPIKTIYYQSQKLYARFGHEKDAVVGELSIDHDGDIPTAMIKDKWNVGTHPDCDIINLSWVAMLLIDAREAIPDGALEYLVLCEKHAGYKRIGIMQTERPIPGMRVTQLQVK